MITPLTLVVTPFLQGAPMPAGEPLAHRTDTEGGLQPHTELWEQPRSVLTRAPWAEPAAPGLYGTTSGSFTVNQDPEGDMPREVEFLPDGSEVAIVNRDTDTLTFLDVATQTVTRTVAVGDFPVDVAVTPNGQYAVVANVLSNSVTVVDVPSGTVAATVPISGDEPIKVAVTSDSAFAVVGVFDNGGSSSCSVIDLNTFSEVRTFATTPQGSIGFFFTPESGIFGNLFTQFALSSDDATLVLPDRGGDQVTLYDITDGSTIATLGTPDSPTSVDISADGQLAVIGHDGTRRVTSIDLVAGSVIGTVAGSTNLNNQVIRVTPDKTTAITAVLNAVQFVDLATGAGNTISTGTVGDLELSFDGQYVMVSNFNTRILDIASQSLVRTITFASCYDAAASPVEHRFVALNNRFAEDAQVYNSNGAAGFFEGFALSGEPFEGDAPRELAISADGTRAIVAHNTSRSAAILDVASESVVAYVPVGGRALGAAITPDGATGLVLGAADDTLTIFDMATGTVQAVLSVPDVPTEVEVSPDSQTAYVAAVAGTDRLYFVDLAGAASSISGSVVTGQMGSIGYTYGVFSGVSVSPDGSLVAVCISFDDEILLIDSATQSELTRVPVEDFPIRATFSPDGTRLYVSHSFGDSLVAIDVNGAASSVAGSVANIEFPLQVTVDAAGAFSYVGSWDFNNPRLAVIDNNTLTAVGSVPLNSRPRSHALSGSTLYVSGTDGEVHVVDAIGAGSSVTDVIALADGSPADMVYSASQNRLFFGQPGVFDSIEVVRFDPPITNFCVSNPNSSGQAATIGATGSLSIADNAFFLNASGAALTQPGLFFYGPNQVLLPFGNGFRCVGGQVSRLNPAAPTDGTGAAVRQLDFTQPPANMGLGMISPGQTVQFQFWFRDPAAGGSFFNLSDGLTATFLP